MAAVGWVASRRQESRSRPGEARSQTQEPLIAASAPPPTVRALDGEAAVGCEQYISERVGDGVRQWRGVCLMQVTERPRFAGVSSGHARSRGSRARVGRARQAPRFRRRRGREDQIDPRITMHAGIGPIAGVVCGPGIAPIAPPAKAPERRRLAGSAARARDPRLRACPEETPGTSGTVLRWQWAPDPMPLQDGWCDPCQDIVPRRHRLPSDDAVPGPRAAACHAHGS
jgi:hypothetical protein